MDGKKIAFYALLVSGVGLCIGGVFLPPLIPVGAALIAGAVSVGQNLVQSNEPRSQQADPVHPPIPEIATVEKDSPSSDSLEVDLHIGHRKHHTYRLPKTLGQPDQRADVRDDEDNKTGPSVRIHKLHP